MLSHGYLVGDAAAGNGHSAFHSPPSGYLLAVLIIIAGWLGALVYIGAEVIPDLGLMQGSFQAFPRRRRIRELRALILDNPSAGNYEELAGLLQDEKQYAQARECYDKAITVRTDSPDPFYRRRSALWN